MGGLEWPTVANDHIIIEICCGSNSCAMSIDRRAIASKSRGHLCSNEAYAHATLTSSLGLNSPSATRGAATSPRASKRAGDLWPAAAKAHRRLARLRERKSAACALPTAARASKSSGAGWPAKA